MEIAHKASYSKISEFAKLKANYVMQKDKGKEEEQQQQQRRGRQKDNYDEDSGNSSGGVISITSDRDDGDDDEYFNVVPNSNSHSSGSSSSSKTMEIKQKKQRRFTASVKETGVDTMSQYVKSMGSHELLPKESEILLGRQIQILVQWENVRQELEEKLSRSVYLIPSLLCFDFV